MSDLSSEVEETREETNPVEYTYEDKLEICKVFIRSKSQFTNPSALKRIVDLGFVKPLEKVRDFRSDETYTANIGGMLASATRKVYTAEDVRKYFDWLVGIVAGLEPASTGTFKTAVEQLSTFLFHMRPHTVTDKDPFAIPPVQAEIAMLREQMESLRKDIAARDEGLGRDLGRVRDLLDKYESLFDSLDYEATIGNRVKRIDEDP